MDSMMTLSFCRNCVTSLPYSSDLGTARARVPLPLFTKWKIRLGWILHLKISLGGEQVFDILCTAWMKSFSTHSEDEEEEKEELIIDASVLRSPLPSLPQDWLTGSYTLVKSSPPNTAASIRATRPSSSPSSSTTLLSAKSLVASLAGFPVCAGYTVRLPSTIGTPGPAAALYSILAPTSAGIVSVSSLVTYIDPAIDSPIEAASYSHTSVIRTLFERLVEPLILHHPLAGHTQGILLYGPPGTGKTYSLSALKDMSRDVCSITINNLPLTQLLSMDVKEAFKTISALFNEATDSPLPASTKAAQAIDAPCTAKTVVRTPQVYSGRKSLSPMAPMERFAHGADAFLTPGKRSTSAPATQMKPSPPLSFAARPELSVILLDEVDALGSGVNDSASQALIKRYICSWWNSSVHTTHRPCCLIATSNRPSAVDPALRRGGRLELELQVTPAAASAQSDRKILLKSSIERIVEALRTADVCSDDICVDNIAEAVAISTGGFVAADLLALSRDVLQEVLLSSGKGDSSNACRVGTENLIFRYSEVSRRITPASLRGVTLRLPQLSMDDVIGLDDTKRSLLRLLSFYNPAKRELIRRFKLTSPGGALLYGPPGNSKTRLVLACASSLRLPVISLSVADIYSPYVGDAEAEVRRAFSLARASAPCILFFDEIDAVVTDRTMEGAAGGAETRVLATLLTEIDGLSSNSGEQDIIVLGATNRLESIDSALLRKGRFHHHLKVNPPTFSERLRLLDYFSKRFNLPTSSTDALRASDTFSPPLSGAISSYGLKVISGADIENICKEEAFRILRTYFMQVGSTANEQKTWSS